MATGVWAKQGTVIPAVSSDTPGQPNAFFEAGAVILSGTVFKNVFATTNGICYAESSDGVTWTRFGSNPIISLAALGGVYSYPRVFKNGSTYYMYVGPLNGPIQAWTASALQGPWTRQNTAAISAGVGGAWDAGRCLQLNVVAVVGGIWYGYYTATRNENTLGWFMGLATSTDGINWTKGPNNPVITYEGPSNFCWASVGTPPVYYGWSQITLPNIQGNTSPQLPSDIMRFYAFNPAGPWTPLTYPTLYRTTQSEGLQLGGTAWLNTGQVADPTIVQAGADVWMFYTLDFSGGSWVIGAAKAANTTIAQLVTGYEGVSNIPIPWGTGTPLQIASAATDSFTRANQNPLTGNWTQVSALSGFGQAQLSGNQVIAAVAGTRASYYWNAQAWNADQAASLRVAACANNSNLGVSLRNSTSGAATCYMCLFLGTAGTPGTVRIQKFVAGAFTALFSASSFTVNIGDIITGTVIGTQISMYVNGNLVSTGTDASIASGAPGFVVNGATLTTDAAVDDWTGYTIANPAPIPTPTSGGAGTNNDMLNVSRWCTRLWG